MLPPNHALPQPNLDTEMPEAAVRPNQPFLPLLSRSNRALTDQSDIQAPAPPNELRPYTAHPHPRRATHRNAHPARQRYCRSRGRAADAVQGSESRGAGEAVSE